MKKFWPDGTPYDPAHPDPPQKLIKFDEVRRNRVRLVRDEMPRGDAGEGEARGAPPPWPRACCRAPSDARLCSYIMALRVRARRFVGNKPAFVGAASVCVDDVVTAVVDGCVYSPF